ncbi:MAG: hypothetical protein MJ134_07645 [Lachnospiraceae bacterium]|nr:hypothetical protein [Lachnospiraceae bacterium]
MVNVGTCKFCGQTHIVETHGELKSVKWLNDAASELGECVRARKEIRQRKAHERAEANIETIFEENEIGKILKEGIDAVLESKVDSITVKRDGTTGIIKLSGTGKFKIEKKYTAKAAMES